MLRLATRMVQQLLQLFLSDQLFQMVPQIPAILRSVSLVSMVLAIKAQVTPHGVSNHLVRPFKEWLVLDLFQNLMQRLSEHRINHLGVGKP